MKLNRDQIVKGLECCASRKQSCRDCPVPQDVKDDCRCMEFISCNVLALIRELTEEVAKAKADTVRKMQERFNQVFGGMDATNALLRRTFEQIAKKVLEDSENGCDN